MYHDTQLLFSTVTYIKKKDNIAYHYPVTIWYIANNNVSPETT